MTGRYSAYAITHNSKDQTNRLRATTIDVALLSLLPHLNPRRSPVSVFGQIIVATYCSFETTKINVRIEVRRFRYHAHGDRLRIPRTSYLEINCIMPCCALSDIDHKPIKLPVCVAH